MSFFKKYNGSTDAGHVRLERTVWTLIYGGLLVLVLGYFAENTQGADGSGLYAVGGIALALGLLAFYLRSRQRD
jgi:LPXTG-motif cell wall-anchored protein